MGWACAPIVLYQAIKEKKRARKTLKDGTAAANGNASLSRSLSTDDSGSENSGSVFHQDEDMQYQIDMMDQRDQRDQRCPCGCPGAQFHDEPSLKIKTKEVIARPGQNTTGTDIVDRVFPLDLLRYQGLHHCTEEIAPVWKKDCRRWLWKCPEEPKEKGVVKQ